MTNNNRVFLVESGFTGYAHVFEESASVGGSLTKSYVLGDDVLAQDTAQGVKYLLYDGHGSTRLLADASSAVSDRFDFDAYGNSIKEFNVTNAPGTDLLYSGEQFDSELGDSYLRARYYDSKNGRFNRLDPFAGNHKDPQSLHKYAYCHGNPVMFVDYSGKMTLVETMLVGAGISILFEMLLITLESVKKKQFPGFKEVISRLVIAGVTGAVASAAGYGFSMFIKVATPWLKAAYGSMAAAFVSQLMSEFIDIYVNDKVLTFELFLGASFRIIAVSLLGFVTGGLLFKYVPVPEERIPNSCKVDLQKLRFNLEGAIEVISYSDLTKLAGIWGVSVAGFAGLSDNILSFIFKEKVLKGGK